MNLLNFHSAIVACYLALVGATSLAQSGDREYYILKSFTVKPAKVAGLDDYLRKAYIPAANRGGVGPVGVFRQQESEDKASVVVHVITVAKSAGDASALEGKLSGDSEYQAAAKEFLSDAKAGSAYDHVENSLFGAIEGMPKMTNPDPSKPRILNLRIYESPTLAAHEKKTEMFNLGELAIFKRVGLTPVLFGSALSGPRLPNLTYLLVFPDDEARKAAWKKFGGDSEWQTLKAKPGYSDKEIIRKITNILLTPAPYSQI